MHKEPLISVVVNVCDSAPMLKKCLDTLVLQLYKNIEIICIDNGLSAEATTLLHSYKASDERFKIIHYSESDSANLWNEGLKQAKGDYVHFVNSDCWFMLDLYKIIAEAFTKKAADMGIINAALYKGDIVDIPFYELFDNEDLAKTSDDMLYSFKDIKHLMTKNLRIFNKIYKRKFLEDNNLSFLENNVYCEYLFNIQTFVNSSSVYINPEAYIRYTKKVIAEGAYTDKVFDIFDIITKMQKYLVSENLLRWYVFDFFNFICNALDEYYRYCPSDLKQKYFDNLKLFILSRFNVMPQEVQNNLRKIEQFNFLITTSFDEYNSKRQ